MKARSELYLDASVLVPLFMDDPFSQRAQGYLRSTAPVLIVSDFAAAEFASALGRRVRAGELRAERARVAFSTFDEAIPRLAQQIETQAGDVKAAATLVRRFDLALRTPDALHIAITRRANASLATFDEKMAAAARALGLPAEAV